MSESPELRPLASVPLAAMVQSCGNPRNTGSLSTKNRNLTTKSLDVIQKLADFANTFAVFGMQQRGTLLIWEYQFQVSYGQSVFISPFDG